MILRKNEGVVTNLTEEVLAGSLESNREKERLGGDVSSQKRVRSHLYHDGTCRFG